MLSSSPKAQFGEVVVIDAAGPCLDLWSDGYFSLLELQATNYTGIWYDTKVCETTDGNKMQLWLVTIALNTVARQLIVILTIAFLSFI